MMPASRAFIIVVIRSRLRASPVASTAAPPANISRSAAATALGTALGLAFAWVGVQVMVAGVVEDAGFTVPLWQVAAVAAVAALAGLAACVLPARRAAAVVLSVGGSLAWWLHHRDPTTLDHGINEFQREMRALAPDHDPDRHPRA